MALRRVGKRTTTTTAKASAPSRATTTRRTTAKAAPVTKVASKPRVAGRDVTQYADKPATDYHKAYAKWIVTEVGYDPENAPSKRAAFLRGVSIATAARAAFGESDFLEDWRETTGVAKRGPKRREMEPSDINESDEDFDSDDESDDEIDEDEDSDEFDEDEEDESDEDDDSDDSDEFDEEDEPAPAPKARRAGSAVNRGARGSIRTTTPTKATGRRKAAASDDEFLF